MKKKIFIIIVFFIGFILGGYFFVSANIYNSGDITYDNSLSGAEATNVKDAIDYLYSHGSCGKDMSCLNNPTVTITWSDHGNVDKNFIKIPISGSDTIHVSPTNPYLLRNISCTNGYEISEYRTNSDEQEITITNPGVVSNSECQVLFEAPVNINVSSSHNPDNCNNAGEGCACWYIATYINRTGSVFNYGSHTNCSLNTYECKGNYGNKIFPCKYMYWESVRWAGAESDGGNDICNATFVCET